MTRVCAMLLRRTIVHMNVFGNLQSAFPQNAPEKTWPILATFSTGAYLWASSVCQTHVRRWVVCAPPNAPLCPTVIAKLICAPGSQASQSVRTAAPPLMAVSHVCRTPARSSTQSLTAPWSVCGTLGSANPGCARGRASPGTVLPTVCHQDSSVPQTIVQIRTPVLGIAP